jgi:hypothetical protein
VIIQHIEIGKRGYLWSHEWQEVDLDGIPLGKIREHARRAATFVGKLKTRTSNTVGNPKVTSQHPFIRFRELDEPITDIKIGGELSAIDAAQFGSKYDPENNRSLLPMNNPKSLAEVARLYKQYYQIGRDAAGYLTVSKYIAREINRPATTCQQMISIARAQGLLPKQTKRKRGTK